MRNLRIAAVALGGNRVKIQFSGQKERKIRQKMRIRELKTDKRNLPDEIMKLTDFVSVFIEIYIIVVFNFT